MVTYGSGLYGAGAYASLPEPPPSPTEAFLRCHPRGTDGTVQPFALRDIISADLVVRHLSPGSWVLTVRAGDDAAQLAQPGAGIVFRVNGTTVLSGPMTRMELSYRFGEAVWTFSGDDDAALLDVTGWPVPANALTAQSSKNWTDTDAAETVIKGLVSANVVTRLSAGLTVATDQGRGSSVIGKARFTSLLELLAELGEQGGVGWRVVDDGVSGPVFDCYTPQDRSSEVLLTPQTGTVSDLTYTRQAPTVTRTIVGDEEASTTRKFRQRTNTSAETEWGLIRESFTDQRGTTDNDELDQAGDEALDEGGDKTSVALTLRDVPGQQYGVHYQVGDIVPVRVDADATVTDVVWEARITTSGSEGLLVRPVVGKPDETTTTAALRRLGRGLRQIEEAL